MTAPVSNTLLMAATTGYYWGLIPIIPVAPEIIGLILLPLPLLDRPAGRAIYKRPRPVQEDRAMAAGAGV